MSAAGKLFGKKRRAATHSWSALFLFAARYEGVDERVTEASGYGGKYPLEISC